MRGEEIQHGAMRLDLAYGIPQAVRRQTGKIEQAVRAIVIGQDPAERGERQSRGILYRIFIGVNNCQQSVHKLCTGCLHGSEAFGGSMTKRILVVEDNDLNRKLFCDVLQAGGFSVEPVADGNRAIEAARAFTPNLVVMDIQLQDVSGLDLIAILKHDADLAEVPVLAVTAYAGKGDEQRIRDSGAEGYLSKPVSIGPFMAAVRGLMEEGPVETAQRYSA